MRRGAIPVIVVDSSALVAVLENEPDAERFIKALHDASRRLASAITIYETGIVILRRRGRESLSRFADFIGATGIPESSPAAA
jgi:ribonuclease VapC